MLHPANLPVKFRLFRADERDNKMQNNLRQIEHTEDDINNKIPHSERPELLDSVEKVCDEGSVLAGDFVECRRVGLHENEMVKRAEELLFVEILELLVFF